MIIKTNFSVPMGSLVPLLLGLLWGASGALSFIGIWLVVDVTQMKNERPALEQQLADLDHRREALVITEELPATESMASLKQRVAVINLLAGGQGSTVSAVLARLEQLLPDQAYLVSVNYRRRGGEINIVAESQGVDVLTRFLVALENDESFAEVLLKKQTQRRIGNRAVVQFDLRLKERG